MKLIGSIKQKYFGINHNNWNYCIAYVPKQYRMKEHLGFDRFYYDALEITELNLWFINISKVYDY
jgi:hypothetical protein